MDFLVAILIVIGLVILASWAGAEEKKRAEKRSYHKELNAKLKKIHEKSNQNCLIYCD